MLQMWKQSVVLRLWLWSKPGNAHKKPLVWFWWIIFLYCHLEHLCVQQTWTIVKVTVGQIGDKWIMCSVLCVSAKTNVHIFNQPWYVFYKHRKNGRSIKNIKGKKGSNEFRGKWTLMVLALLVFGVTNYWKFDKHTKLSPHAWRECGEVLSACWGKTIYAHFTIFNNGTNPLRQINVIIKSLWKWQIPQFRAALEAIDNNEIRCTGTEKKHSK